MKHFILSSDIDDKIHVRIEVMCFFEECHCLDDLEVNFRRCFEYFRAVACNACAADDDSAPDDLLQHIRNNDERQTVIGMIARIENLASGPDEYHIITKNILRRH